jgi:hypothetical protein
LLRDVVRAFLLCEHHVRGTATLWETFMPDVSGQRLDKYDVDVFLVHQPCSKMT